MSRLAGAIVALAIAQVVLAAPARAATPVVHASLRTSQVPGFAISSCSYQLIDSRAGNTNYYLMVDVKYVVSRAVSAVRFSFDIDGHWQYTIGQNFHLGSGSQQFKLISPSPTVRSLTCSAKPPLE